MRCFVLTVAVCVLHLVPLHPAPAQTTPAAPSVRFTGYIQARETYRDAVGLTGSINRARLTAYGSAAKDVTWRVQGEFRTGSVGTGKASVSLQDAYVRYKTGPFGIQAGQFKTPFTREFITSLADVETADRATVVDSIAPKRDIGSATVTLGVFNGEGQNVTANSDSSLLWVGRATVRPIAYLTVGANAARYGSDSTRYGVDGSLEYMGGFPPFRDQRRGAQPRDDRWRERGIRRWEGACPGGLCLAEDRDAGHPTRRAHHPGAGQVLRLRPDLCHYWIAAPPGYGL